MQRPQSEKMQVVVEGVKKLEDNIIMKNLKNDMR